MKCSDKHGYCHNDAEPGRKMCSACLFRRSEGLDRTRADRKARGLCRECPAAAIPGQSRCVACSRKNREALAARRDRIKQNVAGCSFGLHANDRAHLGYVSCSRCGELAQARQERIREKQKKQLTKAARKRNQRKRAAANWRARRAAGTVQQSAQQTWRTRRERYGPTGHGGSDHAVLSHT